MIRKSFIFDNCATGVEDLTDPQGDVVGKVFIIVDQDTQDVYRVPMSAKTAKHNGQMMMGISSVKVADQGELAALLGGR